MKRSIIILDRDGVVNKLLTDPATGLRDSPMTLEEIEVFPWSAKCLRSLYDLGFKLGIATNQPAFAKGKNTFEMLNKVHDNIMNIIKSEGAIIASSQVCFHRHEDNCNCRKPKSGMLEEIFKLTGCKIEDSWMVGDRAVDIIAGYNIGMSTALIGDMVDKELENLKKINIIPNYIGSNLESFVNFIQKL